MDKGLDRNINYLNGLELYEVQPCRTCLSSGDEMESIFSQKLIDCEYVKLSNMVSLCTGIEISEFDTFTNSICKSCVQSIINAFRYRKSCWESHGELLRRAENIHKESQDTKEALQIDNTCVVEISTNLVVENDTTEMKIAIRQKEIPKSYNHLAKYVRIDETNTITPYCCVLCASAYRILYPLQQHLSKQHKIEFVKNFKCDTCFKCFSQKNALRAHSRLIHGEHRALVCDHCGKQFSRHNALQIHIRRHTGEKPYKCDYCDYRAVTYGDLQTHIRWHTGDRPYKCHVCGQTYQTSSHLANHVRQHSDERPYKCEICGTSYKSRKVYKSHMNTHDPKKTVECTECNKIFSANKYLAKHMKQHRPRQYKCFDCDATFDKKRECRSHMRIEHNKIVGINVDLIV